MYMYIIHKKIWYCCRVIFVDIYLSILYISEKAMVTSIVDKYILSGETNCEDFFALQNVFYVENKWTPITLIL